MLSFRWWLLCAGLACAANLQATPPLTTISDTLFNADGTLFNGVVTISWPSFEASDTSNIAAETEQIQVNSGVLYVQLVPTTNANTAAIYTVQYANLGVTLSTEAWAVPPSTVPLRVRDVRVAPGTITGSAPAAVTLISIADVTGLQTALNSRAIVGTGFTSSRSAVIDATGAIDGASGNLSDCLHVDGTSGPCSTYSTTFIDAETPSGTLDGVNAAFVLANVPNPPSSLALFRNGLLLEQGADYTLTANNITFQTGAVPQPTDVLIASYRLSVSIPGVGFVDQETPSGTVNGVNAAFTLSQTPSPSTSLIVYRNGVRQTVGVDYTVTGSAITFLSTLVPQTGDILLCSYRTAQ
ncbi:MAG TPA: hypothetical protein VME17_12230 [Bryobacteraceae bacterium]|nr:hypothetical protein [Bryobacteraceae bacterium]